MNVRWFLLPLLILLGLQNASANNPRPPTLAAVVSKNGSVYVLHNSYDRKQNRTSHRIFRFNSDGRMVQDFPVEQADEWSNSLTISSKGQLLLMVDEGPYKASGKVTVLQLFNKDGTLKKKIKLDPYWSAQFAKKTDTLFIAQHKENEILFRIFDIDKETKQAYLRIPLASLGDTQRDTHFLGDNWVVDSQGQIITLVEDRNKGVLKKFDRNGKQILEWSLTGDETVAQLRIYSIDIDEHDNIFVAYSWVDDTPVRRYTEAYSSYNSAMMPEGASQAAIVKFDKNGKELLTKSIEVNPYNGLSVDASGSIYLYAYGPEIFKYSPQIKLKDTWIATPPTYGETWDQRADRMKKAHKINGKSGIDEAIQALLYGIPSDQRTAYERINEIGAEAVPALIKASLKYPESGELQSAVNSVFSKNRPVALKYLTELFYQGDRLTKNKLAPMIGYEQKPPNPDIVAHLNAMLLEGDSAERHEASSALSTLPIMPEVVTFALGRLGVPGGVCQNTSSQDYFDPDWLLGTHMAQSFEPMKSIILDSTASNRVAVRTFLIGQVDLHCVEKAEGPREYIYQNFTPEMVSDFETWAKNDDSFIADTGAIAFSLCGKPGFEKHVLKIMRDDSELFYRGISALERIGKAAPDNIKALVPDILDIPSHYSNNASTYRTRILGLLKSLGFESASLSYALNELTQNTQLTSASRASLLSPIERNLDLVTREQLLTLLRHPKIQNPDDDYFFYSFYSQVLSKYKTDSEITNLVKETVLKNLERGKKNISSDSLSYRHDIPAAEFGPLLDEADVSRLLKLLEVPRSNGDSSDTILALLWYSPIRVQPTKAVEALLDDDWEVVQMYAARVLTKSAHPKALEVLVEDNLKQRNERSWDAQIESVMFKPYGQKGESVLVELLQYPNPPTREAARKLLCDLHSEQVHTIIKQDVDEVLKQNGVPDLSDVECLLTFGDNLVSETIHAVATHQADNTAMKFYDSVTYSESEPLIDELRKIVEQGTDKAIVTTTLCTLETFYWEKEAAQKVLKNFVANPPNELVREVVALTEKECIPMNFSGANEPVLKWKKKERPNY